MPVDVAAWERWEEEVEEAAEVRRWGEEGGGRRWEWISPPTMSASEAVPPRTRFPLLSLSPSDKSLTLPAQEGRRDRPLALL